MEDLIGTLAAIIIPVLLIGRQIYLAMQQAGKEGKPGPQRRPRPANRPPAANRDVDDEVEQFLRRAAEHRAGRAPQEVELLEPSEPAQPAPPRRVRQRPPAPKIASPQPVAVEVVSDDERRPREFMQQHHLESALSNRTLQPAGVQRAEHQFDERLHEAFDHKLGSIGVPLGEIGQAPLDRDAGMAETSLASTLLERLSNPATLQEAIVLQEILRRPASLSD